MQISTNVMQAHANIDVRIQLEVIIVRVSLDLDRRHQAVVLTRMNALLGYHLVLTASIPLEGMFYFPLFRKYFCTHNVVDKSQDYGNLSDSDASIGKELNELINCVVN